MYMYKYKHYHNSRRTSMFPHNGLDNAFNPACRNYRVQSSKVLGSMHARFSPQRLVLDIGCTSWPLLSAITFASMMLTYNVMCSCAATASAPPSSEAPWVAWFIRMKQARAYNKHEMHPCLLYASRNLESSKIWFDNLHQLSLTSPWFYSCVHRKERCQRKNMWKHHHLPQLVVLLWFELNTQW